MYSFFLEKRGNCSAVTFILRIIGFVALRRVPTWWLSASLRRQSISQDSAAVFTSSPILFEQGSFYILESMLRLYRVR